MYLLPVSDCRGSLGSRHAQNSAPLCSSSPKMCPEKFHGPYYVLRTNKRRMRGFRDKHLQGEGGGGAWSDPPPPVEAAASLGPPPQSHIPYISGNQGRPKESGVMMMAQSREVDLQQRRGNFNARSALTFTYYIYCTTVIACQKVIEQYLALKILFNGKCFKINWIGQNFRFLF